MSIYFWVRLFWGMGWNYRLTESLRCAHALVLVLDVENYPFGYICCHALAVGGIE